MRPFVISRRAREPETHLLGGVAHGRGGGGGRLDPARVLGRDPGRGRRVNVVAGPGVRHDRRAPAGRADAGRARVPASLCARRDDAPEGSGERRHGASAGWYARAGSPVLCANDSRSHKARRGCDGRGPRGKRAQSKVASHFSRCVSVCLTSRALGPKPDPICVASWVHDSRNRPSNAHMPTWSFFANAAIYEDCALTRKRGKIFEGFPSKKRCLGLSLDSQTRRPRTVGNSVSRV